MLGVRGLVLATALALGAALGCGDPNDEGSAVGIVAGVVREAETELPVAGATVVVAGHQVQSGADGVFEIDSVPAGTQPVTASKSGYADRTVEVEVEGGVTTTLTLELVPDLGPPGPTNVTASVGADAPATITIAWDPVEGATSYTVYWATHPPANAAQGIPVPNAPNPFVHGELSAGTTYYYTVVAHGPDGDTRPSAEVSATPNGPISISFVNPMPTQIVGARFVVSVEISSVFQLLGVTAQVEGLTDELVYIPASDEWEGFFDVGDMPSPSFRTVHYTATDAAGNVARTAVPVRLDHLPVVTLSAPMDDAFSSAALRVTATCTDDHPSGCEALVIQAGQGGGAVTKVVAQSSVDQTISLAEFDGFVVQLRAAGRDRVQSRIPRVSSLVRRVYVDASHHLVPVASAGSGTLLDASATRLLSVDGDLDAGLPTDTLRLVDRGTGQSTVVYSVLRERARNGALFPGGVIFLTQGELAGVVREWRNGAVTELDTGGELTVASPYAIWSSTDALIRRELTSGTSVTVTEGRPQADVAPNGDVAWAGDDVFLFRDGTNTQLTTDGGSGFANTFPITDGANVVYQRRSVPPASPVGAIMLAETGDDITLADDDETLFGLVPGDDYEAADGWVAFVRRDVASTKQIWRRSPDGEVAQVSAFGASSTIEAIGPEGEIVFISEATGTMRRYRADVGASPDDISSGLGAPVYVDGQLHLMMGATLLRVE